ncbi:MAG: ATP-binding cassette domain-containing protein [Gemmatimonadetes bacterium]|nr:ATP-binding cassette domain-containing protein [Gemmatimonadota bacterium]
MVLELDSIGVSYGARRVLTAASLRAPAGRVTVLVGRNGVGKTSLLRAGVGLEPRDHGTVRLMGRWYPRPRLASLARAGLFFLPARSVLEPFISLNRQLAAVSAWFAGPSVEELTSRFGLDGVVGQRPAALSSGELRRAELAVAVARNPVCLIADEPFRGLDPLDIEVIVAGVRALAERGAAVVLTGHELPTLRNVADAVVWCVAGSTREFPTASAAWGDPQLRQEFLGVDRLGTDWR